MNRIHKNQLSHMVRNRIRRLRRVHGLTQEQLCELAGISVDAVSRIEQSHRVPTLGTLEKISRAFGLTVSEFVQQEGPPKPVYPQSIMRIVHQLQQYDPYIHEACEKTLKVILKSFLSAEIADQVLRDADSSAQ
jgi:transcriptional regulator with XRE-family HTH domain